MNEDLDSLLVDFYSKYTEEELTPEKINSIKNTYGDDIDGLLQDLYQKYGDGQVDEDKLNIIKETYGLKKKDQTEPDLVGESGTSDVGPGGLDSSEVSIQPPLETPNLLIDGVPIEKNELIDIINTDETFVSGLADGSIDYWFGGENLTEEAQEELGNIEKIVGDAIESYRSQQEVEEPRISEETVEEKIEKEDNRVNPEKAVPKESLVPINERPNININETSTYNLVNPIVNEAMDEIDSLWSNHPTLNIESTFRDEELNDSVRGHKHSYHLHGMAIDLTGQSARDFMNWIENTEEGKNWAEKWTEGADGGAGVVLEYEGEQKEHVHIQFKKGLSPTEKEKVIEEQGLESKVNNYASATYSPVTGYMLQGRDDEQSVFPGEVDVEKFVTGKSKETGAKTYDTKAIQEEAGRIWDAKSDKEKEEWEKGGYDRKKYIETNGGALRRGPQITEGEGGKIPDQTIGPIVNWLKEDVPVGLGLKEADKKERVRKQWLSAENDGWSLHVDDNFNSADISSLYTDKELSNLNEWIYNQKQRDKGYIDPTSPHQVSWSLSGLSSYYKQFWDPDGKGGWKWSQSPDNQYYKELYERPRKVIENYLNNGWEHVGGSKYKHKESGIIITPEDTEGRNPLIANHQSLPELVKIITSNPNHFVNENGEFDSDKLLDYYNKSNPIVAKRLEEELGFVIRKEDGVGDRIRGEHAAKATVFLKKNLDAILRKQQDVADKSGANNEFKKLGRTMGLAEKWMEKQIDLLEEFPINANGTLNTRNLSREDILRYNNLLEKFQYFHGGRYQELLKEQEEMFSKDTSLGLFESTFQLYDNVLKYGKSGIKEDYPQYSDYQDRISKRILTASEQYEKTSWFGASLRNIATSTVALQKQVPQMIAALPQQFYGMISDENTFDWTDAVASFVSDGMEERYMEATADMEELGVPLTSFFFAPKRHENSEYLGNVYYTDVDDNTIIFDKDGEIKHMLTKDNIPIEDGSDMFESTMKEYQENKEKYPTETKKEWGSFTQNFLQAGMGFALDMAAAYLTRGKVKKMGYGMKSQKAAFYAGMTGMQNRMYYNFYEEALNAGLNPADATDFSNAATFTTAMIEIATPDFGMLNAGTKRMLVGETVDAILGKTKKSAVNKVLARNIISNTVFYGGFEGLEEVSQGVAVDGIKNNWYGEYNFDANFEINRSIEEFMIGGILGGSTTLVTNVKAGRKNIMSGLYKDGVMNAYTKKKEVFKGIDNMVGETIIVAKKPKVFTKTDAKKLKEKLAGQFKTLDNMTEGKNISDIGKREILGLLDIKNSASSLQGIPEIKEEMSLRIKEADKAMESILAGKDVVSTMNTFYDNMDTGISKYLGPFTNISGQDMDVSVRALIRKINKGDVISESEKSQILQALSEDIKNLDSKSILTSKEKTILNLYKKIEKDINNLKTVKDAKTTTKTRGRGKTGRTTRGTEGTSIREDIEQAPTEGDKTTLNQNIGKKVSYKGREGVLAKNKKGEFVLKPIGKGRSIKIKDATGRKRLSTLGLKYQGKDISVTPEGDLIVEGDNTGEILGMSKNDTGGLEGVITLDNKFSNEVKDKARKEFKKLQNKRNKGDISQNEFIDGVRNIEGLNLETSSDVRFKAAADKMMNDILNSGNASVISMLDVEQMIKEAEQELGYETQEKEKQQKEQDDINKKRKKKQKTKKQKSEVKPLFDSTTDNIDDLIEEYSKYEGSEYRKIVENLKIAKKLFNKLGFTTIIHADTGSMNNWYSSRPHLENPGIGRGLNYETGVDGVTPEIHINLELANPNTSFHEVAHPFVTSIFKLTKSGNKNAKKLVESLEKILPKKYLDFGANYALFNNEGEIVNKNEADGPLAEALTEFLADAGLKKFNADQGTLNKAKNFAKSIFKSLGIGPKNWTADQDPITIGLKELSDLTTVEDVVRVFTRATSSGANLNELKKGRHTVKPKFQYNINEQIDAHHAGDPNNLTEETGSTFNDLFGDVSGKPYTSVSIFTDRTKKIKGKKITKKDIEDFIKKNKFILDQHDSLAVGTWFNSKDGFTYIDISSVIPKSKQKEAEALGKKHNQISIFNLENFEYIDTDGDGKNIKHTPDNLQERIKTIQDIVGDLRVTPPSTPKFQVIAPKGTKSFNNWFGESKTVNNEGEPVPFYHGTSSKMFTQFDAGVSGSIFFSPDPEFANVFAAADSNTGWIPNFETYLPGSRVLPVYIKAENTWDYENPEHREMVIDELQKRYLTTGRDRLLFNLERGTWNYIEGISNVIKRLGFDSYHIFEQADVDPNALPSQNIETIKNIVKGKDSIKQIGVKNIAVFNSNQVRSINRKDYTDIESPKFQKVEHKTTSSSINFTSMETGTPQQWMAELKRVGGTNIDNELRFIGMKDFLDAVETAYVDFMIPKVAIQDYIEINNTSIEMDGFTMRISNPLFELAKVNVENRYDDNGEMALFVSDIIAPDLEMMSNIMPVVRSLVRFASDNNYDSVAFADGSAFDGPKAEFFGSAVPQAISDVLSSIDSNAGPVLTGIGGKAQASFDVTNKITALSEDTSNPSNSVENTNDFQEGAKTLYSTKPKMQKINNGLRLWEHIRDFSLKRELLPEGNIPKDVFNKEYKYKGRIQAEKFKLMKLVEKLRTVILENQKSDNPLSLKQINDALSDPTIKIQELQSELEGYESDLDLLETQGKSYAAKTVLKRIRETEAEIKELKKSASNRSTLKDLDSAPEIQKLVKQVRRKIDSLSRKLKSVVNEKLGITIDKNLGLYVNRQYRIHHDKKYVDNMIKIIDNMINADNNPDKLAKTIKRFKKEYDIIQNAANLVRERLEKYRKNNGLNPPTEHDVLQEIKRMFDRDGTPSEFGKTIFRADEVNNKIFKIRKDIPSEIAALFDEVQNPLFNMVNSITKMVDSFETMQFQSDVVSNLEGTMIFREDNRPTGKDYKKYGYEFTLPFSNIKYYTSEEVIEFIYGELPGYSNLKWAQFFNGAIKLSKTVWSIKTHVRNLMGNMYFASINGHFSPKSFLESIKIMQNLYGKSTTKDREMMFISMIENGIVDSVHADELKSILKDGGLGVFMGDLFEANMDIDKVKKKYISIRDSFKDPKKVPAYVKQGFKLLNSFVNKTYLWEDVVWKGAAYISEVQLYQDAGYSRDEAVNMAAENIRGGYTTYSLVPKLGKRLRRAILLSDFVSFPAEIFRTGVGSLMIAKKHITSGNPVLVKNGLKRLAGTAAAWYALPHAYTGIVSVWATLFSMIKDLVDDEEEYEKPPIMSYELMNGEELKINEEFTLYENYSDYYDKSIRGADFEDLNTPDVSRDKMIQLFVPHYMKYGDVKLTSWDVDDNGEFNGTYYIWNSSDNLSQNVLTNIWSALWNTPENDPTWARDFMPQFKGSLDDVFDATVSPFVNFSMSLEMGMEIIGDVKDMDYNKDSWSDIAVKATKNVWETASPSVIKEIYSISESYNPDFFLDEDELHKKKSPIHETLALTGFRFSRFNIAENLNFKVREMSNHLRKLDPEEKSPKKIEKEVKKTLVYMDKLYHYSDALGIEQDGVELLDDNGERITRKDLPNKTSIIRQYIKGFGEGNKIYDFIDRDRKKFPTYDSWIEVFGDELEWSEFLNDWQKEELEKQLSE